MSLREIAQNLGISITTASRALGGYPDVAAATRERVRAEAERIGYVPNEVARRLQSGRSDALGFLVPGSDRSFDEMFFLNIIEGAWGRLAGSGVDLLVMSASEGRAEIASYKRLVEGRRVDGLIVGRIRAQDPRIEYLSSVGFPYVAFGGRPETTAPSVHVEIDAQQTMGLVLDHLAGLGHHCIALLAGDQRYCFASARARAFEAAAAARGLIAVIQDGSLDEESGRRTALQALAHPGKPTALVGCTDRVTLGAARALAESGLELGIDVSLVAIGDNPIFEFFNPPIDAVRLPTQAMAAHAVDLLFSIRDGLTPRLKPAWQTELVARQSSGPATECPVAARTFAALGRVEADATSYSAASL